ncbi:hypothetical protein [Saccharothrix lopnurensis]|uniref:Uncharacterized protein n=1 Tax=Saccharothrix lopnurensis TaxID=1670621 RepID=A0ABW1P285_9PSEU
MFTLRSAVLVATALLTITYLLDIKAVMASGTVGLFSAPVSGVIRTATQVSWVGLIAVIACNRLSRQQEERTALVLAKLNNTLRGVDDVRQLVNGAPGRRHLSRVDNN